MVTAARCALRTAVDRRRVSAVRRVRDSPPTRSCHRPTRPGRKGLAANSGPPRRQYNAIIVDQPPATRPTPTQNVRRQCARKHTIGRTAADERVPGSANLYLTCSRRDTCAAVPVLWAPGFARTRLLRTESGVLLGGRPEAGRAALGLGRSQRLSLVEAQQAYLRYGAVDADAVSRVVQPGRTRLGTRTGEPTTLVSAARRAILLGRGTLVVEDDCRPRFALRLRSFGPSTASSLPTNRDRGDAGGP